MLSALFIAHFLCQLVLHSSARFPRRTLPCFSWNIFVTVDSLVYRSALSIFFSPLHSCVIEVDTCHHLHRATSSQGQFTGVCKYRMGCLSGMMLWQTTEDTLGIETPACRYFGEICCGPFCFLSVTFPCRRIARLFSRARAHSLARSASCLAACASAGNANRYSRVDAEDRNRLCTVQ